MKWVPVSLSLARYAIDEEPKTANGDRIHFVEEDRLICIGCGEFDVLFDKSIGRVTSLIHDGKEMLAKPIGLELFRAPTDNDRPRANAAWYAWGLDKLEQNTHECGIYKSADDYVTLFCDFSLGRTRQRTGHARERIHHRFERWLSQLRV